MNEPSPWIGEEEHTDDALELLARHVPLARSEHRALSGRRRGKPAPSPSVPEEILEQMEADDAFAPSFSCSDNEQEMLSRALTPFYQDHIIVDVIGRVKGGKEANVYCCRAHPSTGLDLIAAKIYRPRAHRTLRNDAVYKEGRLLLDDQGKGIVRDSRLKRAVARKTEFGREVMTFSWIEHEYAILTDLFAAGADVPQPFGHVGAAILMAYLGDVNAPAPTMNGVRLASPEQARSVFERLLWHVELLLGQNRVHGDLSPYNVLWWEGRGVVIDFPQAVIASTNRNARWILGRDVRRLCDYFRPYGLDADPDAIAEGLWERYMRGQL